MTSIHLSSTRVSQEEHNDRVESIKHLIPASKDINDWEFKVYPRPDFAPKTCDHLFEGRCKKTGITQPWLIDNACLDEQGGFDLYHARHIEAFAESLLYLQTWETQQRARNLQQQGFALPEVSSGLQLAVKNALWRGDHPNTFA